MSVDSSGASVAGGSSTAGSVTAGSLASVAGVDSLDSSSPDEQAAMTSAAAVATASALARRLDLNDMSSPRFVPHLNLSGLRSEKRVLHSKSLADPAKAGLSRTRHCRWRYLRSSASPRRLSHVVMSTTPIPLVHREVRVLEEKIDSLSHRHRGVDGCTNRTPSGFVTT